MTTINLSNLYKIDAEDLVYFVAKHLLKQNKKSILNIGDNNYESYAYRASDGKSKCAVGSIISDEEYSKEMEGNSPSTVYDIFFEKFYKEKRNCVNWREKIAEAENLNIHSSNDNDLIDEYEHKFNDNMCYLEQLRCTHDNYNPEHWKSKLINLAYAFSDDLAERIETIEEIID